MCTMELSRWIFVSRTKKNNILASEVGNKSGDLEVKRYFSRLSSKRLCEMMDYKGTVKFYLEKCFLKVLGSKIELFVNF